MNRLDCNSWDQEVFFVRTHRPKSDGAKIKIRHCEEFPVADGNRPLLSSPKRHQRLSRSKFNDDFMTIKKEACRNDSKTKEKNELKALRSRKCLGGETNACQLTDQECSTVGSPAARGKSATSIGAKNTCESPRRRVVKCLSDLRSVNLEQAKSFHSPRLTMSKEKLRAREWSTVSLAGATMTPSIAPRSPRKIGHCTGRNFEPIRNSLDHSLHESEWAVAYPVRTNHVNGVQKSIFFSSDGIPNFSDLASKNAFVTVPFLESSNYLEKSEMHQAENSSVSSFPEFDPCSFEAPTQDDKEVVTLPGTGSNQRPTVHRRFSNDFDVWKNSEHGVEKKNSKEGISTGVIRRKSSNDIIQPSRSSNKHSPCFSIKSEIELAKWSHRRRNVALGTNNQLTLTSDQARSHNAPPLCTVHRTPSPQAVRKTSKKDPTGKRFDDSKNAYSPAMVYNEHPARSKTPRAPTPPKPRNKLNCSPKTKRTSKVLPDAEISNAETAEASFSDLMSWQRAF